MGKKYLTVILLYICSCQSSVTIEEYPTGQKKLECERYENSAKTGSCTYYYPSGLIKSRNEFVNDTLDGLSTYYHKNGLLSWEAYYTKELKNGEVTSYDTLGRVIQRLFYKDNLPHGEGITYYPNGQHKDKLHFDLGVATGLHRTYHPNGVLGREVTLNQYQELIGYEKYDTLGNLIDAYLNVDFNHLTNDAEDILEISLPGPIGNEFFVLLGEVDTSEQILLDTLLAVNEYSTNKIKIRIDSSTAPDLQSVTGKIYDLQRISETTNTVVKRYRTFKYNLMTDEEEYFFYSVEARIQ